MRSIPPRGRPVSYVLASLLLAGCGGDSPTDPGGELAVSVEAVIADHVERGLSVNLEARDGGEPVPASDVSWTAEPDDHVELTGPDRARLLEAGAVTFRASAGGLEGERTVEVAAPPEIAFALRGPDHGLDVWIAALDGRDPRRLTDDPADDGDPAVGGGVVTFVSRRHGNGDLYRVALGGGTPERLTATAAEEDEPALTPDGGRLAFTRETDSGVFRVWTAGPDGSGAARATTDFGFGGSVEGSPSLAPAGDRLVMMATAGGTAGVWMVRSAEGSASAVADGDDAEVEPAWHPEADRVVFAGVVDGDAELFLAEIATGALTRLTTREGSDGQPAWLPDGRLVYTAWVDGEPTLRWLDPAAPVTSVAVPTPEGTPSHPAGVFP